MATLFLVMIYLSFITLGLPDSLLGAAWPTMHKDFDTSLSFAGVLSITIAYGTIMSSLASGTILKRLATGQITLLSCLLTAFALLGFYYAPSMIWLIVLALLLGLGAGSVDSALNHYVAKHYKAHHMSWLHCFWGVGATLGPIIMAAFMSGQQGWREGYVTIAFIQFAMVVLLFITLPLWKRMTSHQTTVIHEDKELQNNLDHISLIEKPMQLKGVKITLITFLFYSGAESSVILWGSTYLVTIKELEAVVAAQWISMYYGGMTIGRFITGFVTYKVSNHMLIRSGLIIALVGALLFMLPLPIICSFIGLMLIGLGFGPIYPCMLHDTPKRFGNDQSQKLMGYQMAAAYTGNTLLPPVLGWIAAQTSIIILPFVVASYIIIMLLGSERMNRILKMRITDVSTCKHYSLKSEKCTQ
ncbi:MFS transporter [Paenibacillus arenosi]|uniref:MFS transporter n=1 Tax=Paenibacillus arenosi TaxID=2774142 RepID=A0ABR9B004_9BACL|nr:MFS transporter [Paenibacillus arenosi]